MASWMIHLRIANEILPCLDGLDETAFVMGNMAPDSGVPNEDWSEFSPPYAVSHFKVDSGGESRIDTDSFREKFLNFEAVERYTHKEYSFFLGYYAHLLTDVLWSETVNRLLQKAYPEEYARDRKKLIRTAKEDWYDLDFLYLEEHPDFRAFSLYENAVGFENEYMDLFEKDAFDNRRRYICSFYHSGEHGDLHRKFRYLTPDQASSFVEYATKKIL